MAIKFFVIPLKINNIIVLKGSSQYKIEQSEDSHYLTSDLEENFHHQYSVVLVKERTDRSVEQIYEPLNVHSNSQMAFNKGEDQVNRGQVLQHSTRTSNFKKKESTYFMRINLTWITGPNNINPRK